MLHENEIGAAKRAARQRALAIREGRSARETARLSEGICTILDREFGMPEEPVLAFWPVRLEPDILPWIRRLLDAGRTVAFPVVTGPGTMRFRRVTDLEKDFEPGKYGIPEPRRECPEIAPSGLALVPGLAFAPDGRRLGYGGGFYDRLLGNFPGTTVGICPEAALFSSLPEDSHDRRVSYICTERELLRCPS